MLTADRLRQLLHYDLETGLFTWLVTLSQRRSRGKQAGTRTKAGYVCITIEGKHHLAHNLAWLWVTGEPSPEIDHRDGDGTNNRWANLRQASRSQNMMNVHIRSDNTSGFKGVSWSGAAKKWWAKIEANKVFHNLGYYDCPAAAHFAYVIAADKMHGEFARFA